ncbi:MAG: PEP/pyruvate-binding domain-containing protein [Candidatus Thorarchaeota archaeon]
MSASKLTLVQPLDTVRPEDVELHGGKATNIARLNLAGFCVPRGFSISSHNFTRMIKDIPKANKILDELKEVNDFDEILNLAEELQTLVNSYQMPEDLKSEISREFHRLQEQQIGSEWGYAVRSSATIEDRSDISFAGQANSYLCVNDISNIFDAVIQVWKSVYSPSAAIYLKTRGVPISQAKMAVVVQEMIPASVSGVMFTANVVSNRTEEMLVNATWGLGETLVSGRVIPDTFILSKNPLSVIQQEMGTKDITSVVFSSEVDAKMSTYTTPRDKRERYTLENHELLRVAQLGLEIEKRMGLPQDIEWCIRTDGEIVILQSRPITSLRIP